MKRYHSGLILASVLLAVILVGLPSCTTRAANPGRTSRNTAAAPPVTSARDIQSIPLTSDVNIGVSCDQEKISAGDTFVVELLIDSQIELRAAQWWISYDSALLSCEKIDEGNFFKDWATKNNGTSVVFPQPSINNEVGSVSEMGIAVMSQVRGGGKGGGVLCRYTFTALSGDISFPEIVDLQVSDQDGKMFRVTE